MGCRLGVVALGLAIFAALLVGVALFATPISSAVAMYVGSAIGQAVVDFAAISIAGGVTAGALVGGVSMVVAVVSGGFFLGNIKTLWTPQAGEQAQLSADNQNEKDEEPDQNKGEDNKEKSKNHKENEIKNEDKLHNPQIFDRKIWQEFITKMLSVDGQSLRLDDKEQPKEHQFGKAEDRLASHLLKRRNTMKKDIEILGKVPDDINIIPKTNNNFKDKSESQSKDQ